MAQKNALGKGLGAMFPDLLEGIGKQASVITAEPLSTP